MTNIQGADGEKVHIDASQQFDNHTFIYFIKAQEATHVPTADLLAALDATANTDLLDEMNAHAVTKAKLAKAKAERDQHYAALGESEHAANEWKARAEKAEAALGRVEEVLTNGDIIFGESVEAAFIKALRPKPAFTLPTEAGARFTAQGKYDAIGQRTEFITFTGGAAPRYIVADKDEDVCYTGAGVMTHYEDHRLIGAES